MIHGENGKHKIAEICVGWDYVEKNMMPRYINHRVVTI